MMTTAEIEQRFSTLRAQLKSLVAAKTLVFTDTRTFVDFVSAATE
jgi:hypothetical protein